MGFDAIGHPRHPRETGGYFLTRPKIAVRLGRGEETNTAPPPYMPYEVYAENRWQK
jgi:hypothetical protein